VKLRRKEYPKIRERVKHGKSHFCTSTVISWFLKANSSPTPCLIVLEFRVVFVIIPNTVQTVRPIIYRIPKRRRRKRNPLRKLQSLRDHYRHLGFFPAYGMVAFDYTIDLGKRLRIRFCCNRHWRFPRR